MGLSEDINEIDALEMINNAKELLKIGAITQEEFDEIKSKYLAKINMPHNIKTEYLEEFNKLDNIHSEIYDSHSFESFLDNDEIAYDKINKMAEDLCGKEDSVYKEGFIYEMRKFIEKMREDNKRPKIHCPNCGELIPDNSTRCKHCNIMLNKFMLKKSEHNTKNKVKIKNPKVNNSPLDNHLQKYIEDNLDKVCNIFALPNLGKKFVISKLSNEYTSDQIAEKLNQYGVVPKKETTISNGINDKELLINKLCNVPEHQLNIFFLISERSPILKEGLIDSMEMFWSYNTVKEFYEEYLLFLKQGIQEKDFKKVLEYNIKETFNIFSIPESKQILGKNYIIKSIINSHSAIEIKEKLDNYFDITQSMYEDFCNIY